MGLNYSVEQRLRSEFIRERVGVAFLAYEKHPKYTGRIDWGACSQAVDEADEKVNTAMFAFIYGAVSEDKVKSAFKEYIEVLCQTEAISIFV